ncbi:YbgC/FadM family acyl-CoA thioesterase [Amylibacter sp. SFDW26]|uniref:YbgC/FadM family acyl-CoA thioesterase n=1 Tax=Amylibacter sp. SFDW26 TaxID=2652722 RepID=UPI0012621EDA|nr:YbgC/FadM family acyl-CoA thioesterase [Amylibacter sp. SFDW26]KAB7613454.1 YbgC/FadM family acyl-CoA thioesterase [Amylibacter sp. SFDW26]
MKHKFPIRVYYEDTDLAGIVYYANYLKFIERARSTLVLEAGIDQVSMRDQELVFAVKKVEANYIGSAKLNDDLSVETILSGVTGAKIVFTQNVYRDGHAIFSALVTVVCITISGKIVRFPADIRAKLNELVK